MQRGCRLPVNLIGASDTAPNMSTKSTAEDLAVFFASSAATALDYPPTSVTIGAGASRAVTTTRDISAPVQVPRVSGRRQPPGKSVNDVPRSHRSEAWLSATGTSIRIASSISD